MNPFKQVARRILGLACLLPRTSHAIFCFHDVSAPDEPQYSPYYSTTISNFRAQIDFIAKNFKIIPLDELVSSRSDLRSRSAAITFDDGYLSVKSNAKPILDAMRLPFSIFLNKSAVLSDTLKFLPEIPVPPRNDGIRFFLGEQDVTEIARAGVIVGSHTASHPVLSACTDAELRLEIEGNREFLEGLTGKPVHHLALPYGKRRHYSERVIQSCRNAGHRWVYSTNPALLPPEDSPSIALPRISLLNQSLAEIRFILNRALITPPKI